MHSTKMEWSEDLRLWKVIVPFGFVFQKELRALRQKPEFMQLLDHCNKGCEGANLEQLLTLPCERVSCNGCAKYVYSLILFD